MKNHFSFKTETKLITKLNFMRKFRHLSSFLLAITFIVVNCTKEGPQGPAGAIGATGGTGPTGPVGPQGPAGTANVTYSAWYSGTWKTLAIPGPDNGFSIDTFIRAAPSVTQTIMDNGVVLGYMRGSATSNILTGTQVVGLPYHDVVDDDHFKFILSKPGSIVHSYQSNNPWTTDEFCHEQVGRIMVDLCGCAHLLDFSFRHDHDPIPHSHRFYLVVGYINCSGML